MFACIQACMQTNANTELLLHSGPHNVLEVPGKGGDRTTGIQKKESEEGEGGKRRCAKLK